MSKSQITVGFTGHRPDKLYRDGYHDYHENFESSVELACQWLEQIISKYNRPVKCAVGGALGFDTIIADAAERLLIPFDLYIPFAEFSDKWNKDLQLKLMKHMECANHIYVAGKKENLEDTNNGSNNHYFERNKAIVDDSAFLVCCWNSGYNGTGMTVNYAKSKGKKVVNKWLAWKQKMHA